VLKIATTPSSQKIADFRGNFLEQDNNTWLGTVSPHQFVDKNTA
jgi:hypothetical protein